MSNKVLFRVNAGETSGIGHLVRCVNIAHALSEQGVECHFALGYAEQSIVAFLQSYSYESLYSFSSAEFDEAKDAELFAVIIANYRPDWVIIDDYRLGVDWERIVSTQGVKILAVDDLKRYHYCDLLLDIRWRGVGTIDAYNQLVPKNCINLLGPSYVPLSSYYKQSRVIKKSVAGFTMMLGLGGGGALDFFAKILATLLSQKNVIKVELSVLVLVGPLATNTQELINSYKDHPQITFLEGVTELYPYLCQCDLYFGAAGGVMYQLRALNIPAITFSLADNQDNPTHFLEDIGHYFHLGNLADFDERALLNFVEILFENYSRVLNLSNSSLITVDCQGANRIAEAIIEYPIIKEHSQLEDKSLNRPQMEEITSTYLIRSVVDADINHYLQSRNLAANCKNMIDSSPIEKLQHYSWWFASKRESYLLFNNHESCLYIWHQVKMIDADKYLIGGWFVCHEGVGFQDSIIALNWQLKKCEQQYPGIPWIAVINRDNKYVKLMNDYLGFTEIGINHQCFQVVSHLFEGADHDQFYFVIKEDNH